MIIADSPILQQIKLHYELEQELGTICSGMKKLIDEQSFKNEVCHALEIYITSGKPVYWFDAVTAVDRKIKALLTAGATLSRGQTKTRHMLQAVLVGRSKSEKDFIKVIIIHHSLLKLLKDKTIRFTHVEHCSLHNQGAIR